MSLLADDSKGPHLENLQFRYSLGRRWLYGASGGELLFTNNETDAARVYGAAREPDFYAKDAFHRYIVNGEACVNPNQAGTKACIHYSYKVPAQDSVVMRLRLVDGEVRSPLSDVDKVIDQRRKEADDFYEAVHPPQRHGRGKADSAAGFRRHVVGQANLPL